MPYLAKNCAEVPCCHIWSTSCLLLCNRGIGYPSDRRGSSRILQKLYVTILSSMRYFCIKHALLLHTTKNINLLRIHKWVRSLWKSMFIGVRDRYRCGNFKCDMGSCLLIVKYNWGRADKIFEYFLPIPKPNQTKPSLISQSIWVGYMNLFSHWALQHPMSILGLLLLVALLPKTIPSTLLITASIGLR